MSGKSLLKRAGSTKIEHAVFDETFHPMAPQLNATCGGALRP